MLSREAGEASPTTVVSHGAGEYDHAIRPGGGSVGDDRGVVRRSPLLEKYVYRETIGTDISEDYLPGLGEFLESVGLQHKLEVSIMIAHAYVRMTSILQYIYVCVCVFYSRVHELIWRMSPVSRRK